MIAIEAMAIEIVDLPIDSMVIFQSVFFWYVYQRVQRVIYSSNMATGNPRNGALELVEES